MEDEKQLPEMSLMSHKGFLHIYVLLTIAQVAKDSKMEE